MGSTFCMQRKSLKEEQARCSALAAEKRRVETENRNLQAKIADGEPMQPHACRSSAEQTMSVALQTAVNVIAAYLSRGCTVYPLYQALTDEPDISCVIVQIRSRCRCLETKWTACRSACWCPACSCYV